MTSDHFSECTLVNITFTQMFQKYFHTSKYPWKRLHSTNTTLQTQEPMNDSQGLNNTLFGMSDIAGNSSHNLLFRGIGVLDLWYLSPFICCFLLDKENKNVTSFYLFDKACTARHMEMCMNSYSSLCVVLINSIS